MKKIDTLLPKKLQEGDASYKTVEDLNDALCVAEEENIKNIALTGPFGSGKSSVLFTLMEDFNTEGREYLPISLATLQSNNEYGIEDKTKATSEEEGKRIENLNRKIEYSILQQLIYREKDETVPNSRFRRIIHIPHKRLCEYAGGMVLTIISIFVLFEPQWLRVDSFYQLFNLGSKLNTAFDLLSAIWLLYVLFIMFKYIFNTYSNSKLNKLNLKDGEIELVDDNSIFNKHLDEILYFFQVTKYNVVIIEDLDRFGTPNIFLKLRELNQLLNESKIVGRHVTFVYAIKDDVFKDEERTKFFDYITTVIPVINPSNSKDKLKELLKKKGFEESEILDEDLAEMAFFIQDMRILTNIVNEYKQYRDKLCTDKAQNLNLTKLLAMIVYKNYYPQDFAQLHCRDGKVYSCISKKRLFIEEAIKTIEDKKKEIISEEEVFLNNKHLHIAELRLLLLYKIRTFINKDITEITVDGKNYSLENISNNKSLFEKIVGASQLNYIYIYTDYGYCKGDILSGSYALDAKSIDKNTGYLHRISILEKKPNYYTKEKQNIRKELIAVKALRLKQIISQYDLSDSELYKSINLTPMQDVFLRRGYIDEEYYDYISYFYEGMVSQSDRELLLNIKRQIAQPYDYHIDKVENFVKELKPYMFEHKSILNIDLLDYIAATPSQRDNFEHFMSRLENENPPFDFLTDYYIYGKCSQAMFEHILQWNKTEAWKIMCLNSSEKYQETLTEAYLKFCEELESPTQEWLNFNYTFLTDHVDSIGLDRCLEIACGSDFDSIQTDNEDMLDCVIEYNSYKLSLDNLFVITNRLLPLDDSLSIDSLNYTRILSTQNKNVIDRIESNIEEVLKLLHDEEKDESVDSILSILNNNNIDPITKEQYLKDQYYRIPDFACIEDSSLYIIAIKDFLITPNWDNVLIYYNHCEKVTDELVNYIEHYASELARTAIKNDDSANVLFEVLMAHDVLSVSTFKLFTDTFTSVFDYACDELKNLDKERMNILINKDKLSFNQEVLNVMNETDSLCNYIDHFYHQFRMHFDWKYNWTEELATIVLNKEIEQIKSSLEVVNVIPKAIRMKPQFAGLLSAIYLNKDNAMDEDEDIAMNIIANCNSKKSSIVLAIRYMKLKENDYSLIEQTLGALGGKYACLNDKSKRPTFDDKDYNLQLLNYLKDAGYIASYKKETKEKETLYRAYPTKSK